MRRRQMSAQKTRNENAIHLEKNSAGSLDSELIQNIDTSSSPEKKKRGRPKSK